LKELLRIIDQQNFAEGAALQELLALACIHTGTHGRNVQRLADIRNDLHRKHSATTAVPCMKPTQKVR